MLFLLAEFFLGTRHATLMTLTRPLPTHVAAHAHFWLRRLGNGGDEERGGEEGEGEEPPTCSLEDPLVAVLQTMLRSGAERVYVVGAERGEPVGVVTLTDVLHLVLRRQPPVEAAVESKRASRRRSTMKRLAGLPKSHHAGAFAAG